MTPFSIKPRPEGGVLAAGFHQVLAPLLRRSQGVRFILVGVGNTLAGYLFFLAALRVAPSPTVALAISTAAGIVFNFLTTGRYVFGSTDPRRFWRFGLAYGVTFVFNALVLRAFCQLGLAPQIAGLLAIPPGAALSYLISRTFVFKARR